MLKRDERVGEVADQEHADGGENIQVGRVEQEGEEDNKVYEHKGT